MALSANPGLISLPLTRISTSQALYSTSCSARPQRPSFRAQWLSEPNSSPIVYTRVLSPLLSIRSKRTGSGAAAGSVRWASTILQAPARSTWSAVSPLLSAQRSSEHVSVNSRRTKTEKSRSAHSPATTSRSAHSAYLSSGSVGTASTAQPLHLLSSSVPYCLRLPLLPLLQPLHE